MPHSNPPGAPPAPLLTRRLAAVGVGCAVGLWGLLPELALEWNFVRGRRADGVLSLSEALLVAAVGAELAAVTCAFALIDGMIG